MPYKDFRWIDVSEETEQAIVAKVMTACDDDDEGMTLEVTLTYPEELHESHNDFPLCPERITSPGFSAYQLERTPDSVRRVASKQRKLIAHLGTRERIVLHAQALRFYIEHGMQLTTLHRGVRFTQKRWLREYIEMNTKLRQQAKSQFEVDFYKLMNNSCYGKTMENVRKRQKIVLVDSEKALLRHVKKPTFKRFKIFGETLVALEKRFLSVTMEKPLFVGSSCLDIAKIIVYRFHYDHMLPKYGHERLRLLMTDTDSLIYSIQTDDLYADMLADRHLYDTSNYDRANPLHSMLNHKKIGLMKDETPDMFISEFCGVRSKMYSVAGVRKPIKRAKGIAKSTVQHSLRHIDYVDCLTEMTSAAVTQRKITNRNHQVQTVVQERVGLSSLDDKRYILADNISTLAHGHWAVPVHEALRDLIRAVDDATVSFHYHPI